MNYRLEKTRDALEAVSRKIREGRFSERMAPGKEPSWWGSSLFSTSEDAVTMGAHTSFTIVTPHAGEAALLLDRMYELFRPLLDECIEHDFFDRIAEAAVEYSGFVDREDETVENLLKILMAEATEILDEMIAGEFPFVADSGKEGDF